MKYWHLCILYVVLLALAVACRSAGYTDWSLLAIAATVFCGAIAVWIAKNSPDVPVQPTAPEPPRYGPPTEFEPGGSTPGGPGSPIPYTQPRNRAESGE